MAIPAQKPGPVEAGSREPAQAAPAKGRNFHLEEPLCLGGVKTKCKLNLEAIRLLKEIEAQDRLANPEEQARLALYTGWGGIPQAFDPNAKGWEKEFRELRELLDGQEYTSARASTPNAHYTSFEVIDEIYAALERFGLSSGRILEPAMGVGNFFSRLPESMRGCKLTGIELDGISGRIARQLYPDADIRVQGFEETDLRDNSFDAAIGNIPFGNYHVADARYDQYSFLIHDYFFAKALDKVRPGGMVAFITSKGTMDKEDPTVRRYLARRARLLGAVRLPDTAFRQSANTEVTTDLLFLQKRETPGMEDPEGPAWLGIGKTDTGVPVNRYYQEHPEMLLGEMVFDRSMYGKERDTACVSRSARPLRERLREALGNLRARITAAAPESERKDVLPAGPDVRNFTYAVVDGALYYRVNGEMERKVFPAKDAARVKGMDGIRRAVLKVLETQRQDRPDAEIAAAQKELNEVYDSFTGRFGPLSDRANQRAFREDNDLALLTALEYRDKQGRLCKADIFTRRTIRPAEIVEEAHNAQDALTLSLNVHRKVDFFDMSRVYGKPPEQIAAELGDAVYPDPARYDPEKPWEGWLTADAYLSGNVREKLHLARMAEADYTGLFARNVAALEQVQPKWLEPGEIDVQLGAPWIGTADIDQFLYELLDTPQRLRGTTPRHLHVVFDRYHGSWSILNALSDRNNVAAVETYGTRRKDAYSIIEDTLNLRSTVVKDARDNGRGGTEYRINHKQTVIARSRQEGIKAAFRSWIFRDPARRERLVSFYNEHYNNLVPRQYDGSRLLLPGLNPRVKLRPHQLNAVARCISGDGNVLLGHVVGAGKTYTMIAAAHEQIRLGLASKAAFVVPNHLTGQFGGDITALYPDAKVLIAQKQDFEKGNRQRFLSRIAMSDVQYVVLGQSQFEKIEMSAEFQKRELERQLDELMSALREIKEQRGESYSIKQMETQRHELKAKLKKLTDSSKKDGQITFEQLGVDCLYVDEAHSYKNLGVFSKMHNVAGVSSAHAKKASDLLMKIGYLNERGGIVTFATGTPLSNTMAELYVMQKYLQPKALTGRGIHHFDQWASAFGEVVTSLELAPEGNGYRPRTRFARFHNLPELMAMFRQTADIQTADMLDLPKPKLAGGKPVVVKSSPSAALESYMAAGLKRVERIHNGTVKPWEDNMLKFTSDAKKAGLDMRLIDPALPNDLEGKLSQCTRLCLRHYRETMEQRGVQLVFCDTGTPKKDAFDVYHELKRQMVELGVPENEIAFIHDARTDLERDRLFARCRSGEVRVLLGSTQKCGAGTNIQDRLIALHHLDCPYRPSDIEQREGRILRQGNLYFDEVSVYRYVTEKSFDAYLWSIVETKAKFISQVMTAKEVSRTCEDVDEAVLSYAEVKAIASGDPRIKELMDMELEINRLTTLKTEYEGRRYRLEDDIHKRYPARIAALEQESERLRADIATRDAHPLDGFAMELAGRIFTEREKAGKQLHILGEGLRPAESRPIGSFRGFEVKAYQSAFGDDARFVILEGRTEHRVELSIDHVGAIRRVENALKGLDAKLEEVLREITRTRGALEQSQKTHEQPFEQEQALKRLIERKTALDYELNLSNKGEEIVDVEAAGDAPSDEERKGRMDLTVVLVEPGKPGRIERFRGELGDMRALVGGELEISRPYADGAVLVCNADGKARGLEPNRTVDGCVIAGSFFVCGESADDFVSLDRGRLNKYLEAYARPERFYTGSPDVPQENDDALEYWG